LTQRLSLKDPISVVRVKGLGAGTGMRAFQGTRAAERARERNVLPIATLQLPTPLVGLGNPGRRPHSYIGRRALAEIGRASCRPCERALGPKRTGQPTCPS